MLSVTIPLLSSVLVLLTYVVFHTLRQADALKDFGGEWSTKYSRLWLLWADSSGRLHKVFTAVNDKYGSTARIAPHMLITTDPELIKRMNAVKSPFSRSEWYTALRLHPTKDNITSVTDEALHSDIRNRMAPGYSGKENTQMENDIDSRLLDLFDLISKKYITSESNFRPVDLSRIITFFTLDVISTVAFGQAFGFIKADNDPFGYIANLQEFLPAIIVFGVYPELQKILRLPLFKAVMPTSTDKRGLGRVMGFAKERVDERFGEKRLVRKDMLGSFIARGMTQEQLESETLTQITAGSDSTASALRTTLYYISSNPAVYDNLMSEARSAIAAGAASRPMIKDSEARRLPYLQACIKEGLRMYPPVTGLMAKQVPPEGAQIEPGKFAPAGTWIATNFWGMQRNPDIFGTDAEIYKPERWIARQDPDTKETTQSEIKRVERMTETVGMVFGYGRFGCLGRGVAMMELNKGLIETLLRFDLQVVDPTKPFIERCVGFFLHTDMMFQITHHRTKEAHDLAGKEYEPAFFEGFALPGA